MTSRKWRCVAAVIAGSFFAGFVAEAEQAPMAAAPGAAAQGANAASSHPEMQFDGIWIKNGKQTSFAKNPPLTAKAKAFVASLKPSDDPGPKCTEAGIGRMMLTDGPIQIITLPKEMVIIAEHYHMVRRIRTDLTAHTDDPDPTFYGDEIVHWDGNVMVVDTIGLNGKNWLDYVGNPQTPAMHEIERWHLKDPNTLEIQFTFDVPEAYTHPWGGTVTYSRQSSFRRFHESSCVVKN